jgi:hypothetical protein
MTLVNRTRARKFKYLASPSFSLVFSSTPPPPGETLSAGDAFLRLVAVVFLWRCPPFASVASAAPSPPPLAALLPRGEKSSFHCPQLPREGKDFFDPRRRLQPWQQRRQRPRLL